MSARIAGRSSSHFTRVARVFAHELGIAYTFQPVFDLLSQRCSDYLGNPALRLPVLEVEGEAWFGVLHICRELARRAPASRAIVWPESLGDRDAGNAQELVLQGMSTVVSLVMRKLANPEATDRYAEKNAQSLLDSLDWLERNFPAVRARLPVERDLSFLEVTAFCFLTHLEFRQVVDIGGYAQLQAFCSEFGARPSARETAYRFDTV